MDYEKDYLVELFATKQFSDFRFTRHGQNDVHVHRVLLSAKSPIFNWYFTMRTGKDKKADILDLVVCEGIMGYDDNDEAYKNALRDALFDIIAFCYMRSATDCRRDTSKLFRVRVLSVLLTHALAERFEMPELMTYAENKFKEAFAWFCTNAEDDHIEAALELCFSPETLALRHIKGCTLDVLEQTARWMLDQHVENYWITGQVDKAMIWEEFSANISENLKRRLARRNAAAAKIDTKEDAEVSVKGERQPCGTCCSC